MKFIPGGICAVGGVQASGSCEDDYGVAIIYSKENNASAVFTQNKIVSAPVKICRESLDDGKLSAIVANSGNANCCTGKEGLKNGEEMAQKVSEHLGITSKDVGIASTGIIGRELPMDIINRLIDKALLKLENSPKASKNAAEAIMTTDTFPKELAVESTLTTGEKFTIGGICKGSGMIAPNMATFLCFITTDIQATPEELENSLKTAVNNTFNMVVVDGDVSTNDTVILMASGESGAIDDNFQEALDELCRGLARMIAKDGEGATKLLEVTVKGCPNEEDARRAAKSITTSPLVKSAFFGGDPNWGRIAAAVGYSGAGIDEETLTITLESHKHKVDIVKNGSVKAFEGSDELEIAEEIMKDKEIKIIVDLSRGEYEATSYGCDLTYDYVRINSEYST
ncbi:MAG TPA: bifunctional ornithine acetyltransferase/N-acetylglutamate synthase [Methanobacterium sp.]|nr:bifunctional ornithine acetyltransferase/N-acetylglutamate synthase [Methanobacterium sp.]